MKVYQYDGGLVEVPMVEVPMVEVGNVQIIDFGGGSSHIAIPSPSTPEPEKRRPIDSI